VAAVARHKRAERSALEGVRHARLVQIASACVRGSWFGPLLVLLPCDWLHIQLQRLAIVGHQHEHVRGSQSAPFAALARRPRSDAAKAARCTLLPMLLVVARVRGSAEGQHRIGCPTRRSYHQALHHIVASEWDGSCHEFHGEEAQTSQLVVPRHSSRTAGD